MSRDQDTTARIRKLKKIDPRRVRALELFAYGLLAIIIAGVLLWLQ